MSGRGRGGRGSWHCHLARLRALRRDLLEEATAAPLLLELLLPLCQLCRGAPPRPCSRTHALIFSVHTRGPSTRWMVSLCSCSHTVRGAIAWCPCRLYCRVIRRGTCHSVWLSWHRSSPSISNSLMKPCASNSSEKPSISEQGAKRFDVAKRSEARVLLERPVHRARRRGRSEETPPHEN